MRSVFLPLLLLTLMHLSMTSAAQSKPQNLKSHNTGSGTRIVEDVPAPDSQLNKAFIRVRAQSTPSGLTVPRYVSLKYGQSNGRTGPSAAHPVAWRYKRRGLPMIVVAETEIWRKVRDMNGDESWMDRRLLDGTRTVLTRTEIILRAKPQSSSKKRAIAAKGALLTLEGCFGSGWCRVRDAGGRISGYALRSLLWGAQPL